MTGAAIFGAKAELRSAIANAATKADLAELKSAIADTKTDMMRWTIATLIAGIGVASAIVFGIVRLSQPGQEAKPILLPSAQTTPNPVPSASSPPASRPAH